MSDYPQEVPCDHETCIDDGIFGTYVVCGRQARRVIATGIQSNVDRVSEEPYNESAGRTFRNRAERNWWAKENGFYEISPEETASAKRRHMEYVQAKQDLGEAWTGDIPGRKEKAIEQLVPNRKEKYEEAAGRMVHDIETMTPEDVEMAMGSIRGKYETAISEVSRAEVAAEVRAYKPPVKV